MTEGSVQLQSSLFGLLHCIIQHVLLKPTINKLTAPDSLGEPELLEVSTLEMKCCPPNKPNNTHLEVFDTLLWKSAANASETLVSNTSAEMKANKASVLLLLLFLSENLAAAMKPSLYELSVHLCKAPLSCIFLSDCCCVLAVLPVSLSAFPLCWPDGVAFR